MDIQKLIAEIQVGLTDNDISLSNPVGASEEDIAKIVDAFSLRDVNDLQLFEFLRFSDGAISKTQGEKFVYTCQLILEHRTWIADFCKQNELELPADTLIFADNMSGDFYCYKIDNHTISDDSIYFYYTLDNELYPYAPNFYEYCIKFFSE